jgi:peroxiredoxin Q/BCP
MAQVRQDYEKFVQRDTVVIAIGPEDRETFQRYWEQQDMPFIGLADPDHAVAGLYDQEVKLLKFGRIPAQMVVDKTGTLKFVHYARSMSDIPENEKILDLLDQLNM